MNIFPKDDDGNTDVRMDLDAGKTNKVISRQRKFLQKDVTPAPVQPAVTRSQVSKLGERVSNLKRKAVCIKDKRVKSSVTEIPQNQPNQKKYSGTKPSAEVGNLVDEDQEGGYSPPPSPEMDHEEPISVQLLSNSEAKPQEVTISKAAKVRKGIKQEVNSIKRLKILAKKRQSEDDSQQSSRANSINVTGSKLCPRKFVSKNNQKHLREYQAQWIGKEAQLQRRNIELAKRKADLVRKRLMRGKLMSRSSSQVALVSSRCMNVCIVFPPQKS